MQGHTYTLCHPVSDISQRRSREATELLKFSIKQLTAFQLKEYCASGT